MMGGITVYQGEIEEVVLLGEHKDVTVIVVGTRGGEDAWQAATKLVDTLGVGERALIVDVVNAQVRMAKLRVMGESNAGAAE